MRVVMMVMLIILSILSGTDNDIDGTDNIISAKEGTQVSIVVVLIMITSIDDEHVFTIDCCFEGGDDDHCIVMGDMMSICEIGL